MPRPRCAERSPGRPNTSCDDRHYRGEAAGASVGGMDGPIWRSPLRPVEVAATFVDEAVLGTSAARADRTAVVDALSGRRLRFGELAECSRRLAAGLARRGLGPGDVVSIVAASGVDYPVALYGALMAGLTVASANPLLTAAELGRPFALTGPRLVLVDATSRAAVAEALEGAGSGAARRDLGELAGLMATSGGPAAVRRDPREVALLFPSSGTTGLPKRARCESPGNTMWEWPGGSSWRPPPL
jgi:acyl-CoA synthetase (AMP-forming)/AMP-acid ligase II